MTRFMKAAFAAIVAIVVMGAAASSALATGNVTVNTGSTTSTTGNITLRDSGLGNVIGSITLTASIRTGTIACDLTNGVTIGGVSGAGITIVSPAGYRATGDFSGGNWALSSRCQLTSGAIDVTISGIRFSIVAGFLGTYTYTGSATGRLSADGRTITGVSSSFSSNRSTTANFVLPWSFTQNPAISWAL